MHSMHQHHSLSGLALTATTGAMSSSLAPSYHPIGCCRSKNGERSSWARGGRGGSGRSAAARSASLALALTLEAREAARWRAATRPSAAARSASLALALTSEAREAGRWAAGSEVSSAAAASAAAGSPPGAGSPSPLAASPRLLPATAASSSALTLLMAGRRGPRGKLGRSRAVCACLIALPCRSITRERYRVEFNERVATADTWERQCHSAHVVHKTLQLASPNRRSLLLVESAVGT